ncbi:BT_3928 family protein [Formosa algae]|uniref:Membrane protein YphA (DoxX/SURF4 family)/peroxiredoxin n=1 Tax=Formosa algae TaxID=225843 RepID=A0A9X0YJ33_9FLAO|nr:BT_3928 family protein [Formosa algae]MBP1839426.1 putative membrane protein YphA (DoxX/SURF4 family)/peroxiredoxin [Formosa algae]MDQ0334730.1 putative membrane protein YphA (DoxX/SURF4 family)/peroxiredoxin [Formosa algae]OEI81982.1 DoxX family protein [Formosa algae]
MKKIVSISRILVGVLFIISGLIKLNDPIGFSFKLEEYFSAAVLNLTALEPYALVISILVVIFEVLLGIFLLIGYKAKFTVWSLLLMILFFTFLTFYSAYFNKVTDCGCFGDAIKLTPWQTFSKDIVLLILILIIFSGIRFIKPVFSTFQTTVLALFGFIGCLWFGYHVLMHLPTIDFRPYKVGANLWDNMIVPEDAPKADIDYMWTFNINGEEKVITTKGSYPTVDGEFISVDTKEIDPGYVAPIHDFSIERDGEDFTEAILHDDHVVLLIAYSLEKSESLGLKAIKNVADKASENGYKVIGLTASGHEIQDKLKAEYHFNFDFYFSDETALKTIVRSNPGVLILDKGTVIQKVHWNDVDDLNLIKVN